MQNLFNALLHPMSASRTDTASRTHQLGLGHTNSASNHTDYASRQSSYARPRSYGHTNSASHTN